MNKRFKQALPAGYTLRPGAKHYSVIGPDGELVRHDSGRPLILPKGTKTNHRTERRIVKRLQEKLT